MTRAIPTLLLGGLALAACDTMPPVELAAPERLVHWNGDAFRIDGLETHGSFRLETIAYEIGVPKFILSLHDLPEGSQARVGARRIVPSERITIENVDFKSKIRSSLSLKTATERRADLGVTLELDLPGGERLSIQAPPQDMTHLIVLQLLDVSHGPLAFAGDATNAGPLDTIAVVEAPGNTRAFRVLGPGQTLDDLDWIAIEGTPVNRKRLICSYHEESCFPVATGFDQTVTIYDRRSGRVTARRVFTVEPRCPPRPSGLEKKVDAWLTEQLRERRG